MRKSLKALSAALAISAVASTAVAATSFAAEPKMALTLNSEVGKMNGTVLEIDEKVAAGAKVTATISVDNGVADDFYWCASGVHLYFDNDLTIATKKKGETIAVAFEDGEAADGLNFEVKMQEADALPDANTNGVFYAFLGRNKRRTRRKRIEE